MQKAMNFNVAAIVSIKGNEYRIHFWYISKDDAINIMKNFNLNERNWILINFLLCIKNEWSNLLSKKQRDNNK